MFFPSLSTREVSSLSWMLLLIRLCTTAFLARPFRLNLVNLPASLERRESCQIILSCTLGQVHSSSFIKGVPSSWLMIWRSMWGHLRRIFNRSILFLLIASMIWMSPFCLTSETGDDLRYFSLHWILPSSPSYLFSFAVIFKLWDVTWFKYGCHLYLSAVYLALLVACVNQDKTA